MKKFTPQKGTGYWYVSVEHNCDFANVKVIYEPFNKDINYYHDSHNYFETEAEAKEIANKVRAIFNQPPLE